jgi:hypothetical protein
LIGESVVAAYEMELLAAVVKFHPDKFTLDSDKDARYEEGRTAARSTTR